MKVSIRSNRLQASFKIGVIKKFASIHRKTPVSESLINPNLGGGGGGNSTPPPRWFSLNNSGTLKAWHFAAFSNILLEIFVPNLSQSSYIGQNSDGGISDFRISGQSLIKENYHNSRTSDDIDMKLGPVTKLDKRNKTTSKKFDDDVMSENCDVIVIFSIYGQFGAIWKPDSRCRVCKTYVFINNNLLSYKN